MDMTHLSDGGVSVALSERNLRALLAKVEYNKAHGIKPGETDEASAATIYRDTQAGLLIVSGEPDDIHYDRPEGPPGPMLDNETGRVY